MKRLLILGAAVALLIARSWFVYPVNVRHDNTEEHGFSFYFPNGRGIAVDLAVVIQDGKVQRTYKGSVTVNEHGYAFLDVPADVMADVLTKDGVTYKATVNNEEN